MMCVRILLRPRGFALTPNSKGSSKKSKTTILDKINGTSGPPLPPPISMMPKWRVFAHSRLHHCFGGEGG